MPYREDGTFYVEGVPDVLNMSGEDIAGTQFGYDPKEYGEYFTGLRSGLKDAASEDWWQENYGNYLEQNIGKQYKQTLNQIGIKKESQMNSSRNQMFKVRQEGQGIGSGFAGSGARRKAIEKGTRDINQVSQLKAAGFDLETQRAELEKEKGLFGVKSDIMEKIASAESSIYDWYQNQLNTSLRLREQDVEDDYIPEPPTKPPPVDRNGEWIWNEKDQEWNWHGTVIKEKR